VNATFWHQGLFNYHHLGRTPFLTLDNRSLRRDGFQNRISKDKKLPAYQTTFLSIEQKSKKGKSTKERKNFFARAFSS